MIAVVFMAAKNSGFCQWFVLWIGHAVESDCLGCCAPKIFGIEITKRRIEREIVEHV